MILNDEGKAPELTGGMDGVLRRHQEAKEPFQLFAPLVLGPSPLTVNVLGEGGDGWWRFISKVNANPQAGGSIPIPKLVVVYLHIDDIRGAMTTMEGVDDAPMLDS
jgi:hypothetical protein